MAPLAGLSLAPDPDFLAAALPLFEQGAVGMLTWSFDTVPEGGLPDWAAGLIDEYAAQGRLSAHGVFYSGFSARFGERERAWLDRLAREVRARRYARVSEHFGFMLGEGWEPGAPLPVPFDEAAAVVGADRLERLGAAAGLAPGLENLALAFCRADALAQGPFLARVLAAAGGWLVLDVHNLYCQMVNFDLGADELLAGYPLERVREIHVAGGSVQDGVRRDTHDGAVPEPVHALAERALAACPNVEALVLERLGGTLGDPRDADRFRADFARIAALADAYAGRAPAAPLPAPARVDLPAPPQPAPLARLQDGLIDALAGNASPAACRAALAADPGLAPFADWLAAAEDRMLAAAAALVHRWSRRR